jgi:hypothetical protein
MLFREIIAVCSEIRSSYCWNYRVLLGLPVFVNFVYSYVCYLAVYVRVFPARMRAMVERLLGVQQPSLCQSTKHKCSSVQLLVWIQYCKVYGVVFRCRVTADRYAKRLVINTSSECDVS